MKIVCLLKRITIKMGAYGRIPLAVSPTVIEGLFAADLAYLQDFYNTINGDGASEIDISFEKLDKEFDTETDMGEE